MPRLKIGMTRYDVKDGAECMVCSVPKHGPPLLRKRGPSGNWSGTLKWEPGRFLKSRQVYKNRLEEELATKEAAEKAYLEAKQDKERQKLKEREAAFLAKREARKEAIRRYGRELVRLADANGLTYEQAAEALEE